MLTSSQAFQIASRSVQSAALIDYLPGTSYTTLVDCGIVTGRHFDLFVDYVRHSVEELGYELPAARLRSLSPYSTMGEVVQLIIAYSLPGDDPFPEPPDPDSAEGEA